MSRSRKAAGAQWGDGQVPEEVADILRGLPIDVQELTTWLSSQLAELRAEFAYQDVQPSLSERKKTLKDLASHVSALRDLLQVGGLAVSERAMLRAAAHRRGADLPGLRKRMQADLAILDDIVAIAERTIEDEASAGGKPPMPPLRDKFLIQLGAKLRPCFSSVEKTAECVERLAIACRIRVPSTPRIARLLYSA